MYTVNGVLKRLSKRESFIDNLLVRLHFIIMMIRWTGLAPWEFEFSNALQVAEPRTKVDLTKYTEVHSFEARPLISSSSSLLLSSLELSDTQVYAP